MAKAITFFYWQLRLVCKMLSDDRLTDWKALVILGVCESAAVMIFVALASVVVGHRLWPAARSETYAFAFGLASLVYGLDHLLLTRGNRWMRFQHEFENYSRIVRVAGTIATILVVIFVIVGMGWSASVASHLPH